MLVMPALLPPPHPLATHCTHCALARQDLESRKRAPLYQKKQEEELKAATDKAAEAEVRAGEAELRCKEAKVRRLGGWLVGWEIGMLIASACDSRGSSSGRIFPAV